jgi:tetratricopeptide (TPR) repeat protein
MSQSAQRQDDSYWQEQQRQAELERQKQLEVEQKRQEEAQKQKFIQEKQEALDQLKGIAGESSDIKTDTSSLKSSTSTDTSNSALELKGISATDSSLKSPRFSKGTKYSAPVDVRNLDVTTGKAFKSNKDLRDFIDKANWPIKTKVEVILGILMAEQGRYDDAVLFFQQAAVAVPNELVITSALDQAMKLKKERAKITQGAGHLRDDVINPDEFAYLPQQAQAYLVIAKASISVEDYDSAVKSLNDSLKLAPTDQKLRDALVYARQLKAASDEKKHGKPDPKRYEAAAKRAKANAAWRLGMYLSEKGDYAGAVNYLKEARKYYSKGCEKNLLNELIKNVKRLSPTEDRFPAYRTKAHAILDALEYGKGNWHRSLKYLEVAHKVDKNNLPVRDALNYLQGLHAGAEL